MSREIVTIQKEEYELLVKCRRIVESEFEENFSEDFIKAVKDSEEEYRKANYLKFKNVEEAKRHFDRA